MTIHTKNYLQQELERRILHGLSCEWDSAIEVLEPADSIQIKRPFFSLRDMKNGLGHWSGDRREICMSRQFVLSYPWDDICEVFLHEIAHQFAEEVLGTGNETAHGQTFQKACFMLRANPKASGKYRPLHDQMIEEKTNHEDKIMIRIKKLLALAESSNQHEAEAAMAKAYELIRKYNIDRLSLNKKRDFISIFIGKPALRHFRESYHLSRLLMDFYFVEGIWTSAYVLEKGKMGKVLEISGTVQNVKIADYVYHYVCNYIDSKWEVYKKGKKLNRYRKTDFAVGIIQGFRSKLESQNHHQTNGDQQALVRIEDPLLTDYYNYRYPHISTFSRNVYSQDKDVLNDGMAAGKELVISKGISEQNHQKVGLIGYNRTLYE